MHITSRQADYASLATSVISSPAQWVPRKRLPSRRVSSCSTRSWHRASRISSFVGFGDSSKNESGKGLEAILGFEVLKRLESPSCGIVTNIQVL